MQIKYVMVSNIQIIRYIFLLLCFINIKANIDTINISYYDYSIDTIKSNLNLDKENIIIPFTLDKNLQFKNIAHMPQRESENNENSDSSILRFYTSILSNNKQITVTNMDNLNNNDSIFKILDVNNSQITIKMINPSYEFTNNVMLSGVRTQKEGEDLVITMDMRKKIDIKTGKIY